MITVEQLRALKKGNASVDEKKSMARIPEAFKSASKSQKNEITELTGLTANAFYATAKSGVASPRAVLALAQILDISPYYLTGESDAKDHCDAVLLIEFFNRCSAPKLPKPEKLPKTEELPTPEDLPKIEKPVIPVTRSVSIDIKSLLLLMKALSVRAKFEDEAKADYNRVVGLLLNT